MPIMPFNTIIATRRAPAAAGLAPVHILGAMGCELCPSTALEPLPRERNQNGHILVLVAPFTILSVLCFCNHIITFPFFLPVHTSFYPPVHHRL